jgi:hypothetical protein
MTTMRVHELSENGIKKQNTSNRPSREAAPNRVMSAGIELGEEELDLVAGGTGSKLYSAGDGFIAGVTAGFTSSELRLTTSASLTR